MNTPPDPFALNFDSIPVEPRRRVAMIPDEAEAFSHQPREAPSAAQEPGFYLVDDCNGRFVIERDTGIVSLKDESLLAIEKGAIHPVHIRVIELSGGHYDLKLRLRITGRVPQIAGAEENDSLAGLTALPLRDLLTPEEKRVQEVVTPEPAALPWVRFSVVNMLAGKRPLYGETAPYLSLFEIAAALPETYAESGKLWIDVVPPPPASADAAWTL